MSRCAYLKTIDRGQKTLGWADGLRGGCVEGIKWERGAELLLTQLVDALLQVPRNLQFVL